MIMLMVPLGDTYENTVVKEVGLIRQNLNDDDVFVLDNGLLIYQINGTKCDKDEKVHYSFYVIELFCCRSTTLRDRLCVPKCTWLCGQHKNTHKAMGTYVMTHYITVIPLLLSSRQCTT